MTERRENIARALWEAQEDCFGWFLAPWDEISESTRERWRRFADVAIAADGGAVGRVLALAEEDERAATEAEEAQATFRRRDEAWDYYRRIIAIKRASADRIRDAVGAPATAEDGEL